MAFGIWHFHGFGIWHLAFGIWHLGFGIWHLAFGIWHAWSLPSFGVGVRKSGTHGRQGARRCRKWLSEFGHQNAASAIGSRSLRLEQHCSVNKQTLTFHVWTCSRYWIGAESVGLIVHKVFWTCQSEVALQSCNANTPTNQISRHRKFREFPSVLTDRPLSALGRPHLKPHWHRQTNPNAQFENNKAKTTATFFLPNQIARWQQPCRSPMTRWQATSATCFATKTGPRNGMACKPSTCVARVSPIASSGSFAFGSTETTDGAYQ